jgi:CubicO group peptidase (beta-lactamase class C family)
MSMRTIVKMTIFFLIGFAEQIHGQEINWKTWIEDWRKAYNVPGMSVGIIDKGQVIFMDGFGVLEAGKNEKADEHTLYSIASNTKASISASIASLG